MSRQDLEAFSLNDVLSQTAMNLTSVLPVLQFSIIRQTS